MTQSGENRHGHNSMTLQNAMGTCWVHNHCCPENPEWADELMKALGLDGVWKVEVSRICAELDPLVEAFRTRPLVGEHPYVWVDATSHKVRRRWHVTSEATAISVWLGLGLSVFWYDASLLLSESALILVGYIG